MWKKSGVIKTRKFQVLVLIEFLLLGYGICGLLRGEQSLYTLDTLSVELSGGGALQEEGYYVDGSAGVSGDWLRAGGFSLTPGVYRLLCTYETEETASTIEVRAAGAPFRTLLSNEIPLYTGIGSESFEFYVTGSLDGEDGLEIVVTYYGSQTMTVTGIEIIRTTMGSQILLFFVLMGSLLVNSLVMLYEYTKRNRLGKEWILVWLGVPALAVASSVPLMVDYVINGADLIFHLNRIEFLAESLSQGVFPARIESGWLYGHGYANSIFYCDTFLLIPAILRLIGFPVNFAYGSYVFVVNLATAAVAYLSFGRMFQNRYVGMVGSMLYTLSPYRLYNIYNRSAVGEYTAMIFLPLLVLGFYLLLGRADEENKNHPWDWLVLVAGFSGVVQSHALSFEIAVAFSALLCVVCIKRVFRRRTFPGLCKAVLGTVLVNLWYVGPMLDMMLSGQYRYSLNAGNEIQDRGVRLATIFLTAQDAGSSSDFTELGMYDMEPINLGIALMFAVIIFFLLRRQRKKADMHWDRVGLAAFAVGVAAVFASTSYFPWDQLGNVSDVLKMLGSMIQFPTRLTTISTICMVTVACVAAKWVMESAEKLQRNIFLAVLCGLCVFFAMNQLNDRLYSTDDFLRIYSAKAMGHSNILGGEYLPIGVEQGFKYHDAVVPESGSVTVTAYTKENLNTYTTLEVSEDGIDCWVELPMLYYKGYRALDMDTGDELQVVSGDNGHVRVLLEAGFTGTVHAWYAGMWYWRVFEGISLLTVIALSAAAYGYYRRKNKPVYAQRPDGKIPCGKRKGNVLR